MLECRELTKRYPAANGAASVAALDGIALQLAPGDFVAIEGPSGSGKSTLLLALGGLLAPTSGCVTFEDRDIYRDLSPGQRALWRARHVGFVFQQFHLIPYLSVLDNVLAPTLALPLAGARQRAVELLARFGLADRAEHVPATLSIGEQQRAALARALLHQPQFLLCDEPTGNLDRENAQVVLDYLVEFHRHGGAVLLVTHHAGAAAAAQRVLRLERGRLVDSAAECIRHTRCAGG
jgi:putative ABC transport system ATP-binding protein